MAPCEHFNMCRLEGSDTTPDGHSFCILHSPNPQKSESAFIEALRSYLQRFGNAPFPHFVFPKLPGTFKDWFGGQRTGARVNLSNATFLGNVDFSGFSFGDGAGFEKAVFEGIAHFDRAQFLNAADFSNAHFQKEASFLQTSFEGAPRFDHCRFDGPAYFGVKFSGGAQAAGFLGPASFAAAQFNDRASFTTVTFHLRVNFNGARFATDAEFSEVEFTAGGSFELCRFTGRADFTAAKFPAVVTFRGHASEPVFSNEADFKSVIVDKPDALRFINLNLRRAHFVNADLKQMEFVGVDWCRIGHRRGIYEETLIARDSDVASLPDVEKLYRQLKQNYEERRDFLRAGDFHVGEKEMQLRNPNIPRSMRVMLFLYKLTNGYGESFVKPFCWLIGLILCTAAISLVSGVREKSSTEPFNIFIPSDWLNGLLFSVNEAFHLPAEYFIADGAMRWLQTITGILGPVFIGLFGLAVRNRLRR